MVFCFYKHHTSISMSDKNDESKYMENNYSSNPLVAAEEWWEDAKQAYELSIAEEYLETCMAYWKEQKDEHCYLVDGAVLTCTRCKQEKETINGVDFCVPEGSTQSVLVVTHNNTAKNGADQCFATVADSEKGVNIFSFGNCKNPPDRDKERKALMLAAESESLRRLGTCQYLMELNDKWENLIKDTGYEKVTGKDGKLLDTITMEAFLFCKHGGFIRPISSGYIETEEDSSPDRSEEEIKNLLSKLGVSNPDVAIYMWNFFCNKGLSEYAVAGILGNVYAETGGSFDPSVVRNSTFYGLFQIGDGAAKMKNEGGEDGWKDVEFQCEFAWKEYNSGSDTGWQNRSLDMGNYVLEGTRENFENAASATEAALIWGTSFERAYSGKTTINGELVFTGIQAQEERVEKAEEIYDIFTGGDDK